jgi:hypothetical protein
VAGFRGRQDFLSPFRPHKTPDLALICVPLFKIFWIRHCSISFLLNSIHFYLIFMN